MDVTQMILVSVISLLTLMLLLVGFQVFLLLLDLRKSIKRVHRVLDTIEGEKILTNILKERRKKVSPKGRRQMKVKVDEFVPSLEMNGGQKLEVPRPRFFKGIPKRRQFIE